ncbi:hypothetical protein [Erwinia typographi]|uniref:hypothetical protein n=1 Tax=Erwinia typographi TaxID=371042 RepID=UPI00068ADC57|nr:hypothetical protein [Erwinia typographi]
MTITTEQLNNLRGLIKFALPLPWKWWTSNSHTRLTSAEGKDGDVIHAFKAVDGHTCVNVSSDNMKLIASAVNALPDLLAHIDAQAARIAELENDELRQRLANAEHQLYMKDLAIHNVKASRRAQFRARQAAEKELAALREQRPVYWQFMSVNGDWLGISESGRDAAVKEGCEVRPLFSQPVPAAPVAVPDDAIREEIYCLANHIAGAKGGMPDEWQPWAEDVEDSLRKLQRLNSGSEPTAAPDDLVMQIRRLVHALKNAKPDHSLVKSVPDYMRRKGYWKVTDCLRESGTVSDE